jgi:hypothetical protein
MSSAAVGGSVGEATSGTCGTGALSAAAGKRNGISTTSLKPLEHLGVDGGAARLAAGCAANPACSGYGVNAFTASLTPTTLTP